MWQPDPSNQMIPLIINSTPNISQVVLIADAASSRFSLQIKSGTQRVAGTFHFNVNLDNATPATNNCFYNFQRQHQSYNLFKTPKRGFVNPNPRNLFGGENLADSNSSIGYLSF